MPRRQTKGTKQIATEADAELVDRFRAFCRGRAESLRDHLELAMRRHLDNPPPPLRPVLVPPLPPVPVPKPKGRGKKK